MIPTLTVILAAHLVTQGATALERVKQMPVVVTTQRLPVEVVVGIRCSPTIKRTLLFLGQIRINDLAGRVTLKKLRTTKIDLAGESPLFHLSL